MNEIDSDVAITKINTYTAQIDTLLEISASDGEREKTQLETRIKGFVRAAFKDDDKKIQDIEKDQNSRKSQYSRGQRSKQQWYVIDLEVLKDHLLIYKEELELVNKLKRTNENSDQTHSIERGQLLDNRKIFIVHGHDSSLKTEVELYLRTLHLEPIILHQQVSRNKTIIEKVEFYSDVSFAVILLTADDIGAEASLGGSDEYSSYALAIYPEYLEEMNKKFSEFLPTEKIIVKDNQQTLVEVRDLYKELKMRSRQNVLFECGYFIGKL